MSKVATLFGEVAEPTKASAKRLGYVGSDVRGTIDSRNDDWYTPVEWTRFARQVLVKIDLDPFSSDKANKIVKAKQFFTIEDDALRQSWNADTVWMNPPYTRGLVSQATDKFIEEFSLGHFKAGIILINNMTDTRWYGRLYEHAHAVCNLIGRISFENAAGQAVSGNTRGQSIFLFANKKYGPHGQIKRRFDEQLRAKGQYPLWIKKGKR